MEQTLKRFPEVANVVTNLGRPQEATETMALNQADVYVTFRPKSEWKTSSMDALIPRMDSALAEIPGLDYDFSAPMAMRLDEVVSGVKTELGIKLYGDSLPLLQEKAEEIKGVVERVRGAEDVFVGASAGAMQLELDIDRPAIARYGLTVSATCGMPSRRESAGGSRPKSSTVVAAFPSWCGSRRRIARRRRRWRRRSSGRRAEGR